MSLPTGPLHVLVNIFLWVWAALLNVSTFSKCKWLKQEREVKSEGKFIVTNAWLFTLGCMRRHQCSSGHCHNTFSFWKSCTFLFSTLSCIRGPAVNQPLKSLSLLEELKSVAMIFLSAVAIKSFPCNMVWVSLRKIYKYCWQLINMHSNPSAAEIYFRLLKKTNTAFCLRLTSSTLLTHFNFAVKF